MSSLPLRQTSRVRLKVTTILWPPIFLLLLLLFQSILSVEIPKSCKDRCEASRPNSVKGNFKFKCDQVYKTEDEIYECKQTCEGCPKEICDETINDNNWHCPATDFDREWSHCKDFCSKHRPLGTRESYSLHCDIDLSTDHEKNDCRSQCDNCPHYVCNPKDRNLFHCPHEKFEGACKVECDKARRSSSGKENFYWLNPFKFYCNQPNYDPQDPNGYTPNEQVCQDTCRVNCPAWVCDENRDVNTYHCPSAEVNEECQAFCDKHRKDHDPYYLDCSDSSLQTGCNSKCDSCANPDNFVFVCTKGSTVPHFYCPKFEPENEVPKAKRSYKGACQEKCEKNRNGGFDQYTLDCNSRYITDEEQEICQEDCVKCPKDVCNENNNNDTFNCRHHTKEWGKKENETKEARERMYDEQTAARNSNAYWIIGLAVTLLILLVGSVVACVFIRRKYFTGTPSAGYAYVPIYQQQSMVSTVASQQQQQPIQVESVTENVIPSATQKPVAEP